MKKIFAEPVVNLITFDDSVITASTCYDPYDCLACFSDAVTCDEWSCVGFKCRVNE